eukprot:TRINITY_DN4459_c0_g1_i1.p1 TRINITY_DN4459_c0_g1~~TRINITY_DN4459_c0_g1_i1.p1  ORF type:complete len:131 (+),score=18.12 TRINITY_DN4459_c0_g1_i1:58-450(+)
MSSFDEIMKKVNRRQLDGFKERLTATKSAGELTVEMYKFLYLSGFLGGSAPRERWHDWINAVSLCEPEIDYMHRLVDLPESPAADFIETALSEYQKVDNLPNCQLGDNMLQFLETALDIEFDAATESGGE